MLGFVPVVGTSYDGYQMWLNYQSGDYLAMAADGTILLISLVPLAGPTVKLLRRGPDGLADAELDRIAREVADGVPNRTVPDEILDQADLNRFTNLRNDLGITSNNQLRRNIAVGEGNVDGIDIGEIIGVSGRRGPGVEMPENPIFTTTTVGHARNLDSEVFVLENLAQRLTSQSTGTIRLLSERTVCGSCQGVITQFREMFPNVNLIVRAGGQ